MSVRLKDISRDLGVSVVTVSKVLRNHEDIDLCRTRGVDPTVVALRFSIGHPYVASTLVGMARCEQVETNLKALDFEIDPALFIELQELIAPVKNVVWASGVPRQSTSNPAVNNRNTYS